MKFKYYIFILVLLGIASCKPEVDEFEPSKGGADFSNYLAVGNSLTAGYADGALYKSGQEASFPNILAEQFKSVGGGDFKQPLMVDDYGVGFDGLLPVPKFILGEKEDCKGESSLAPVRAPVSVDPTNFLPIGDQGPFNNIGVPGAKTFHLLYSGYDTLNPYYARFAPEPFMPVIGLTAALEATFFTLWIGNNDVLGYALSGGAGDVMTPPGEFEFYFDQILTSCIQNTATTLEEAYGAVANIPDIMSIPYCNYMSTQIPYNGLVLEDQTQVDGLNYLYQNYPDINFQIGQNPWVVESSDGTWRQMTADDQLLLSFPTDEMKCHGMGVANPTTLTPYPIPHMYILDKEEIANIRVHIEAYNNSIKSLCDMWGLAFVDMHKILLDAKTGINMDGLTFTTTFIQGNLFSLDGIHLTPAGNALVAYYFIEAINETYAANIPQVIVTDYGAIQYP